ACEPACEIWAEGADKKSVNGCDRQELKPAQTLIVWTTPPSPEELKSALEAVKPEKVLVFAISPGMDELKPFLERLAGLLKFVLNKKAGKTSLTELAAATAQKVAVARLGLEWLSKRGQVSVEFSGENLHLTAGGVLDEIAALTVESQLRSLLQETAAFRAHFEKSDLKSLLG
ncbi:MAG: hypothetical protein NT121_22255, partial [Chloroflexi bacterium]|nr:hypothetical protein [Chloroflexota bacterium]